MKLAGRPLAIGGVAVAALAAALVAVLLLTAGPATAKEFATLHVLGGKVEVERAGAGVFKQAADGQTLRQGDVVKTGPDGRAQITYFDGSVTRVDFDTTYKIVELATIKNKARSKIIRTRQDRGRTFNRVVKITDSGSRVETQTPTATASVRGTVYVLIVLPDGRTILEVLVGTVGMTSSQGTVLVHAGEKITFNPDGSHGPVQKLTTQDLEDPWVTFNQCVVDQTGGPNCAQNQPSNGPTSTAPSTSPSGNNGNGPSNQNQPPLPPPPPSGNQPPLASFQASATSGRAPLTVHFTDFSSDPDGDQLTVLWQFGDGATSTAGPSVDHTYSQPGDFQATLTVTDPSGASDSISTTIHVISSSTPAAPDTHITEGPPAATTSTTARFSFDSTESNSTFKCSFDGSGFSGCQSPFERSGLSDGRHTFEVRATNSSGDTDPTPAGRSFTVDTQAPQRPEIVSGPDDPTNSPAARFEFRSGGQGPQVGARSVDARILFGGIRLAGPVSVGETRAPSAGTRTMFGTNLLASSGTPESFQCSLDGSPFSACHSPNAITVGAGTHEFRVRAADEAGNHSQPATFAWRVDLDAPDVTVNSAPDPVTNSSTAQVDFSVSDPNATVKCKLDDGPAAPCDSPASFSELSDRSHSLVIAATDRAGNVGKATVTWRVDTTPPNTTITDHPSDPSDVADATFEFESNEAGSTFECGLDGAAFKPCSSPKTFPGLAEGGHTFTVRATDPARNTDPSPASFSWTISFPHGGAPVVITLTWSSGPADMDLHVQTPDFEADDGGEVWSGNPSHPGDGSESDWATLDHDGNLGNGGEEAITIRPRDSGDFFPGSYHIWVENFSCDDGTFNGSGATVTIAQGASTIRSFKVSDASGDPSLGTWLVGLASIDAGGTVGVSPSQAMDGDACGAALLKVRAAIVGGLAEAATAATNSPGPTPTETTPSPEPSPTETTPSPEPSPTETTPSPDPSPTISTPEPSPSATDSSPGPDAASRGG